MNKKRISSSRITHLVSNEVFVFGSNLQGYHGGGAARFAYEHFGAVWGQGVGFYGQSYAIPTMQGGVVSEDRDLYIREMQKREKRKSHGINNSHQ